MTITNTFASKLTIAFVAIAMAFSFSFAPAHAQSEEELQQQINSLLETISDLQAQIGEGGSSAGVCPYTWTRNLSSGSTGEDVKALQEFLNSDPETRVAASGVGSAGQETNYYGPLTGAAVAKFQTKYRAAVLDPLGLVQSTQFFGPSTRSQMNSLCTSAPADDDDANDDANDDAEDLEGGEASLDDFNARSGDDTSLNEGQSDAPVMDVDFDVEDGDARVSRIDVAVDPADSSQDEDDPWDTFSEVSIWVDGEKVASKDVDSRSDWSEDEPNDDDYRARITGLDWVVREGDNAEFTVGLTVQNNVVDSGNTDSWDVFIPDEGIRAIDAAGVNQYTGDTSDTVGITVEEEGADDELDIRTSSNDPDSTTLQVEENTRSDWETVFIFDLDTDDSVNDITVETATVGVTVSGDTYSGVINDAQLVIDGETYDDFTVGSSTSATTTLTFDIDNELEIDAGDRVEAELQLRFNALSGNYSEGQTVSATSTSADWEAEGSDDITVGGSASSETHTLRTSGAIVAPNSTDTRTLGQNDTTGEFTIEFDVTAFEEDIYITDTATSAASSTNGGVKYSTEGPSGFSATTSASLSSTADEDSTNVFTVSEGTTETFTLTVTIDTDTTGLHRALLDDVYFSESSNGTSDPQTDSADPASDYRTEYTNINES